MFNWKILWDGQKEESSRNACFSFVGKRKEKSKIDVGRKGTMSTTLPVGESWMNAQGNTKGFGELGRKEV